MTFTYAFDVPKGFCPDVVLPEFYEFSDPVVQDVVRGVDPPVTENLEEEMTSVFHTHRYCTTHCATVYRNEITELSCL